MTKNIIIFVFFIILSSSSSSTIRQMPMRFSWLSFFLSFLLPTQLIFFPTQTPSHLFLFLFCTIFCNTNIEIANIKRFFRCVRFSNELAASFYHFAESDSLQSFANQTKLLICECAIQLAVDPKIWNCFKG